MTPTNTYTCAVCKGVFEKGWSDEEAKAELEIAFEGFNTDECDLVCNNCYKAMGFGTVENREET